MAPLNRNWMDWLILLCLNVTIPGILVWKTYSGEITTSVAVLSGLLCLLLLNGSVLAAIRARSRRDGQPISKVKVLGAAGFGLFAALILTAAVFVIPQHNRSLDLAMSDVALSGIRPERDRLLVGLIRQRSENSRNYDNLLAEAQKHPLSPSLYTPESFASQRVIQSTVDQLTKYADMDFQYFQRQQAAFSGFREKMQVVDPAYIESMEAERKGQVAAEQSADSLERAWFESMNSLYGFAASQSKEITLKNGHLNFATDAVKLEFNDKLDKSKTLYQKWQEVAQGLIREHQEKRAMIVP